LKNVIKEEEVRNNRFNKGKAAIEQTNRKSHKARICVNGAESEQYSTNNARCTPKHHGWLHVCPIAPTPEFPQGSHSLNDVLQSCENQ